jgi:hypothetical protein
MKNEVKNLLEALDPTLSSAAALALPLSDGNVVKFPGREPPGDFFTPEERSQLRKMIAAFAKLTGENGCPVAKKLTT